jgi:UDP-GlcNAc:undecaprenyl-phosphate GlcNAc-1-phosphate transferase
VDAMIGTALVMLMSAVAALALTPLVRNMATARGWIDHPDGARKLHSVPVPRVGGIAIYVSFALSLGVVLLAAPHVIGGGAVTVSACVHLGIAGFVVMLVGLADDIHGLGPRSKLFVEGLAALYLYLNGYQIDSLSNPFDGSTLRLGFLALPVTLAWFVGMCNAFNLIDGLDGLAAGVGFFATITLFIAALINGRLEAALLAAALGGALLGFLRYNFNPASIFLGDSGSLFVGFALAAFAVRSSMKSSAAVAVAAPLLALALPILDASIAVARRAISGRRLFEADGDHIHHRLVRMGLTPRRVVILLYAVAGGFGAVSLLTMTQRSQVVGLVVIASSAATWIGIQQLGYSEFGEVRRVLASGFSHERQVIGNNVYLRDLGIRFAQAADLRQLWHLLIEAATRLEFDSVELELPAGQRHSLADADDGPGGRWRRKGTAPAGPCVTWSLPLAVEQQPVAHLVLVRGLDRQLPFDSAPLLAALNGGFAPRLHRLVAFEEEPRPTVAPAMRRPVREPREA